MAFLLQGSNLNRLFDKELETLKKSMYRIDNDWNGTDNRQQVINQIQVLLHNMTE